MQHFSVKSALTRIGPTLALALAATFCLVNFYWPAEQASSKDQQQADYYKFYLAGQRHLNGASIYWRVPARARLGDPCHPKSSPSLAQQDRSIPAELRLQGEEVCLGANLGTPTFAWLMLPLATLDYAHSWLIWWLGSNFLMIGATAFMLSKLYPARHGRCLRVLQGSCAMLAFFPFIANASLGQVGAIILLALVVAFWYFKAKRNWLACIALGFAISIKPFLALFVPALWVIGEHRNAARSLAFSLLFFLAGGLTVGWHTYAEYAHQIQDITWAGTNWNASWLGLIERILSGGADSWLPQGSHQAKLLSLLLSALTCISALCFLRRLARINAKAALENAVTLVTPACLLASPLGWVYYFPILIPCWLQLWKQSASHPQRRHARGLLVLILALCAIPTYIHPSPRPEFPTVWWGTDSIYFYGLLGTYVLSIYLGWAQEKRAH